MDDFLKKTMQFGLGLFDYTKEKVENLVEEMIKRGELSKQEGSKAVEELWQKAQQEQSAMWEKIKEATKNSIEEMSLVRRSEVKALEDRLAALEKRLAEKEE